MTNALRYLHFYGIIHRDLKPNNILVVNIPSSQCKFSIKLIDFGFGKIIGHTEKTVEGYGTLCYVAPEIILRTPYNNSVDIWSLGVTLYYITCFNFPFDSVESNKDIAKKICFGPLNFSNPIWNKKSKELIDIIKRCLEKDTKTRISVDDILEHDFIKKYYKN